MTVDYFTPIAPDDFRRLSIRERGMLLEALADWIDRLNESEDPTTGTRP